MKKIAFFFLVLQLYFMSAVHAKAYEIEYMSEILPAIRQDALVIFDLDETVVEPFPIRPTERGTPSLIRNLQKHGISVMALTLRPAALAKFTQHTLDSIGVNFRLQPPYDGPLYIENVKNAYYTYGIAYIGSTGNKGVALVNFLRQITQMPPQIIFVDDTLQNITDVENSLADYPYEHISFHYNYDAIHRPK